jgi:hypothetical protein
MDSERTSNVQHVIVPKSYPVRKVSEEVAREQARRLIGSVRTEGELDEYRI